MPKTEKATLPRSIVEALPSAAKLAALLAQQVDLTNKLVGELEAARRNDDLSVYARAMVAAHRLNEKMEAARKAYALLYKTHSEIHYPEALESSGQKNVTLAEGFRVGVGHPFRASIRAGKRDDAYVWLANHGLGDLISTVINASTLSAAAKHRITEENRDLPDDLFNVAVVPTTSITGTK